MIKKYYSSFTGQQIDEAINAIINNEVQLEDLSPELVAAINSWINDATKKLSDDVKKWLLEKEDKVRYIIINAETGAIAPPDLQLLLTHKINKVIYNNYIYNLAYTTDNILCYVSTAQNEDGVVHQFIDVNIQDGLYRHTKAEDAAIKKHIENSTIHITDEERQKWNNKISCKAEPIEEGYNLHLFK